MNHNDKEIKLNDEVERVQHGMHVHLIIRRFQKLTEVLDQRFRCYQVENPSWRPNSNWMK